MRVTILTQYYPPELGAPQARLSALAKRLVERGHEAIVLTAMPSYPFGKVFNGYGGVWRRETVDGVKIIRSFIFPAQKLDMLRRLANYFSFVVSSSIVGAFLLPRSDFLIVESPPLFLGLSGYLLSRWKRSRMVLNISDLWPESAVRLGIIQREGMAYRVSKRLEGALYNHSALVTGTSMSIISYIRDRFPHVPLFHLSNGTDTREFRPDRRTDEARCLLGSAESYIAVYVGLHGAAQGLQQILQAWEHLDNESPWRCVFVGEGPEKASLKDYAVQRSIPHVKFLDPRPMTEVPALLASADVVIVPLKTYIPGAVPSKLYEAMASAKPVILIADGEAADIVGQHRAVIVVRPGDIQGIVDALRILGSNAELRRELGQNGKRAVETFFERQAIEDRFIDILEKISTQSGD
jgi:colanic acid biosynthesis glycosyl transferase WcaI